ncbi:MAG: hypothetical protein ACRENA_03285 [Vulcanimicrobiaceae bacterium]
MQATPISSRVFDILAALDEAIGLNWFKHARAAGAADDLLRVVTADGMFTTKIDGWIHAATVTTMSIARFATEGEAARLDMEQITSWSGGNSALRYGRWQTDFHWKIDTRLWQYGLYLKFMRDAYRDAIDDCRDVSDEERRVLQRVVTEFFDQAELALLYRWEVIERSRGFAPHPDATAGAKDRGYTYEVVLPLPQPRFEHLEETGPPPFPRLDGRLSSRSERLAAAWLQEAQKAGIADRWLRVRLGERYVPTRFNGWESGMEATLLFLRAFADGHRVTVDRNEIPADLTDFDLANHAVRFGLVQAEFQRRLEGGSAELTALLRAEVEAMTSDPIRDIASETLTAFFDAAIAAAEDVTRRRLPITETALPELEGSRPIHPRFAAEDPMEPLPWETKDPIAHRKRMERLGYTI